MVSWEHESISVRLASLANSVRYMSTPESLRDISRMILGLAKELDTLASKDPSEPVVEPWEDPFWPEGSEVKP